MPYGDRWDPEGWRRFVVDTLDYDAGLKGLEPVNPWKISTPAYQAGLANGGYALRETLKKLSNLNDIYKDSWKKFT